MLRIVMSVLVLASGCGKSNPEEEQAKADCVAKRPRIAEFWSNYEKQAKRAADDAKSEVSTLQQSLELRKIAPPRRESRAEASLPTDLKKQNQEFDADKLVKHEAVLAKYKAQVSAADEAVKAAGAAATAWSSQGDPTTAQDTANQKAESLHTMMLGTSIALGDWLRALSYHMTEDDNPNLVRGMDQLLNRSSKLLHNQLSDIDTLVRQTKCGLVRGKARLDAGIGS